MRQLEPLRFPLSEQDRALKTPAQPPRFIGEGTGLEGESDLSGVTVPIRAATRTQVSTHHDLFLCRNQNPTQRRRKMLMAGRAPPTLGSVLGVSTKQHSPGSEQACS